MHISNMGERAGIVAIVSSFAALSLRPRYINLPQKERGHQFLMPFLALLYCIITMPIVAATYIKIESVCSTLAFLLHFIPGFGSTISMILQRISPYFRVGFALQSFCNIALMEAYCIYKRTCIPIINRYWTNWRFLYKYTTAFFYEEKESFSVLKRRYVHLRIFFNAIHYVVIALGGILLVFAYEFPQSGIFQYPFFPVFGIIIVGEISAFFNGITKDELKENRKDKKNVEIDPDQEEIFFDKILQSMEDKFGDRIAYSEHIHEPVAADIKHDWEKEYEEKGSLSQITGTYFAAMEKAGIELNPDYVNAARGLVHNQSMLIYNPFYKDMSKYIQFPLFHELLNNHKVLFICGRTRNEEDIVNWIKESIEDTTNLPELWKVAPLDQITTSEIIPDIGIIGFKKIYDLEVLRANEVFFQNTTLIIMLEPSNILGTGQIALRSILQFCEADNKKLTYCFLDRNVDGLVDALSHAVRQSITEVIASPAATSEYCRAFWRAEGPGLQNRILPRISHYLGVGGEIASLAMHEGVNDIHWYSGSKIPLLDLRWNIQQYYAPICQYIHCNKEQMELDKRFHFHEDLWQAEKMTDTFLIAEDEFCNLFEMARAFSSRIEHDGMVNIISENYLLRDYMIQNQNLFSNDPKAIPTIVPDYARTERNFVLRMVMLMSIKAISEKELRKELALHGHDTINPYERMSELIKKHTGMETVNIRTERKEIFVKGKVVSRFTYRLDPQLVNEIFDAALKPAYYVVENEQTDTFLVGNRLLGHVEQVLLPGQFFSYEGKYYQVRSITKENGIIVRRAGDHLCGRKYYRQLRTYGLNILEDVEEARSLRGLKLQNKYADIYIETEGYLEMHSKNYLQDAIFVLLDKSCQRKIYHKEVLRLEMPDSTPEIRYTLCVLFNELFQTIFPNEADYFIATLANMPDCIKDNEEYNQKIRSLVPYLYIEDKEDNGIYFVEDSAIDLGLLVTFERNFQRIMEMVADYLDWYLESKMKESGKTSTDKTEAESSNMEAQQFANAEVDVDGQEIEGEDEQLLSHSQKEADYLTYGYAEIPNWLYLKDTWGYLKDHQFDDSNLQHSRKTDSGFGGDYAYDPNYPGQHYCDFCGSLLKAGDYDVLKDGRERCPECSKDAIKTKSEFIKVYKETVDEMEKIFGISLNYPIKVRMSNARKVNESSDTYKPTPGFDGRVLGYASGGKKLIVENGTPRWRMKSTLVHELAHIWQSHNWDHNFTSGYNNKDVDNEAALTMEGMAVWCEIQYLISMNQKEKAIRYMRNREISTDVYGKGMKIFLKKYPIKETIAVDQKSSPFGKFPKI